MAHSDEEEAELPGDLPPPPKWDAEEKVAAWAYRMLRALENESEREHAERYDGSHVAGGIPVSAIYAHLEREAVERAEVGDFGPLAELLRPEHPMNRYPIGKSLRNRLSPATWHLIVRKLATGQPRRNKGGQKKTPEERRASTRTHDAAEEVLLLDAVLRNAYPAQSAEQIRTAACNAVAPRWGVRANTLANYFKRGEERRLSRP
jgi:hypothetical protein